MTTIVIDRKRTCQEVLCKVFQASFEVSIEHTGIDQLPLYTKLSKWVSAGASKYLLYAVVKHWIPQSLLESGGKIVGALPVNVRMVS